MRKKNTVVIKQRDKWSGFAQFLGDMIAKYAEDMDFESLPDPDKYLLERFIRKAYKVFVRECAKRNKTRILIEIVITS
jgi:hypothetical protein